MKTIGELRDTPNLMITRVEQFPNGTFFGLGYVEWPGGFKGSVVFGHNEGGKGMDHVSVSHNNGHRLPTWDDMCRLKRMFFKPEEMVVQIHPREAEYFHGFEGRENVLHLWAPADGDFARLNHPEEWA